MATASASDAGLSKNGRLSSFLDGLREFLSILMLPRRSWIEGPVQFVNPWQRFWGAAYSAELKQWMLPPVFEELEKQGKIGDLVADIGSGAAPVTMFLPPNARRKRILVDIAADQERSGQVQKVRLDVEKIAEPRALSFRKAVLQVCAFLGIDPRDARRVEMADTLVFSDILNYVDFRKVLRGCAGFLKPGGRMIVVNLPSRGNLEWFSEKGLKDNRELFRFLEAENFEIERKLFPKRAEGHTEEAEELIVLVARKIGR